MARRRKVDPDPEHKQPVKYLSRSDVARWLGLKSVRSLSGVTLPPHDVEVGTHKGYLEETIREWNRHRPGRGRWGSRWSDGPKDQ
ncbi:LamD-like protein [Gordonia phage CloverMinnie]|nr:LamD-like protein [Gordonia phage CloverMinnie]UBF41643.1 helix-turn-helix DNA-binding domain protein [Gordonia phage AnarQue]UOW93024.1 DNA binding protein [Gordonia phage CaiB]WNM74933.1 DNA binding protein [Gordonia phage MossRose]